MRRTEYMKPGEESVSRGKSKRIAKRFKENVEESDKTQNVNSREKHVRVES